MLIAGPELGHEVSVRAALVVDPFEYTSLSCIPCPFNDGTRGSLVECVKQRRRRAFKIVGEPINQLEADGAFARQHPRNPRVGHAEGFGHLPLADALDLEAPGDIRAQTIQGDARFGHEGARVVDRELSVNGKVNLRWADAPRNNYAIS